MYIFSESTIKVSTESTDLQALIQHTIIPVAILPTFAIWINKKGTLSTLN